MTYIRCLWLAVLFVAVGCATRPSTEASPHQNPEELLPKESAESDRLTPQRQSSSETQKSPFFVTTVGSADHPIPRAFSMRSEPAGAGATQDPLRISILNIGAGSCQIIECPGTDDVLVVDCGQMKPGATDLNRDAIRSVFDSAIKEGDVTVVLSHPDADHVNRITTALGDRIPKSVWLGGNPDDYGEPTGSWLARLIQNGVDVYSPAVNYNNRGRPIPALACGRADTYILTVNVGSTRNAQSAVLLLEYGDFRAIFPGDAEGVTEQVAMDSFGALIHRSTLLLASHHGANTHGSNHSAWAAAVAPQIVIFSAGSSHGHPNTEAAKRYWNGLFDTKLHPMRTARSKNSAYKQVQTSKAEYVTALNGTIIVESDGTNVWLECTLTESCF